MTSSAIEFAVPTREDIEEVISNLRESDRIEVRASHGPLVSAMVRHAAGSSETLVARENGVAIALFGVEPGGIISGGGTPWLVGTDRISAHKVTMIKKNRTWIREMLEKYGRLSNYVMAEHTNAVEWLRWLGFKIEDPAPYGYEQKPFHRFSMGE